MKSARDAIAEAMSEAELLYNVTDAATKYGWKWAHFGSTVKLTRSGPVGDQGAKGFPDLVLVHEGRGELWFVELKKEKGPVKAAQSEWLSAIALAGIRKGRSLMRSPMSPWNCAIWRPRDWLDGTVTRVLKGDA